MSARIAAGFPRHPLFKPLTAFGSTPESADWHSLNDALVADGDALADVETQPLQAKRVVGYLREGAPSYGEMSVHEFLPIARVAA